MKTRLTESAGSSARPGTPFVAAAVILNVLGYLEVFAHVSKIIGALERPGAGSDYPLDIAELHAHLQPALERLSGCPQASSNARRLAYLIVRPWATLRVFFNTPFAELPRTCAFVFGVIFTLAWPWVPAQRKRAFSAIYVWALAAGEAVWPLGPLYFGSTWTSHTAHLLPQLPTGPIIGALLMMPVHFVAAYTVLTIGAVALNCALTARKLRLLGSLPPSAPLPAALAAFFMRLMLESVLYGAASSAFAYYRPQLWRALSKRLAAAGGGGGSAAAAAGSSASGAGSGSLAAGGGQDVDGTAAIGSEGLPREQPGCVASAGAGAAVDLDSGTGAGANTAPCGGAGAVGSSGGCAAVDCTNSSSSSSSGTGTEADEPDVARDGAAADAGCCCQAATGSGASGCQQRQAAVAGGQVGFGFGEMAVAAAGPTAGPGERAAPALPRAKQQVAGGAATGSAPAPAGCGAPCAEPCCGAPGVATAAASCTPAPAEASAAAAAGGGVAAAGAAPAASALAAARALVAGAGGSGGSGPGVGYVPHMSLRRVVIRLPDLSPADLPEGWADSLREQLLGRHPDWQLLNVGVRQGSLILVLELLVPPPQPPSRRPALALAACSGPAAAAGGCADAAAAPAASAAADVLAALRQSLAPLLAENDKRRRQHQEQQQEEGRDGVTPPAHRCGAGAAVSALVQGCSEPGACELYGWQGGARVWRRLAAWTSAPSAPPHQQHQQHQEHQQSQLPGCSRGGVARVQVHASGGAAPSPSLEVAVSVAPAALLAALRALEGAAAHAAAAAHATAPAADTATAAVARCAAEDFSLWLRLGAAAPPVATPGAAAATATATASSPNAALPALRYSRSRQPLQLHAAAAPTTTGTPADANATADATADAPLQLRSAISAAELAALLPAAPPVAWELVLHLELWHNPSGLLCGSAALPLPLEARPSPRPQPLPQTRQQRQPGAARTAAPVEVEAAAGWAAGGAKEAEAKGRKCGTGLCVGLVALDPQQHALAEAASARCTGGEQVLGGGCCCLSPAA